MRSQVATNSTLLSEKLSLQRQLSELNVQLEHSKSEVKRAQAKRRNTTFEIEQEETVSDLQKALTREKRLREKAEEALETAQAELESEKKSNQRKMAKDTKAAENEAGFEVQLEEARRQMAAEKKEKDRAAKTFTKSQQDWEATKALLDDKLNQFRSKLKATKEKLNLAETQLVEAQQAAVAAAAQVTTSSAPARAKTAKKTIAPPETKATKKRKAGDIDPDSQKLGTPGQEKATKRGRKAAAVGDKSTFSITPFLNRTLSIAPESPSSDKDDATKSAAQPESDSEAEVDASPAAAKANDTASKTSKKQPLAPIPASKSNIKKPTAAARTKKALASVQEEEEPASQPSKPKETTTVSKIPLKGGDEDGDKETQKPKPKQKVRKSLATFTSFMLDPEPAAEKTKTKKRKLGGLGKTLFDDEDGDNVVAKPLPGRGAIFGAAAARSLGPFGGLGKGAFGGALGAKKKGGLMEADGFAFSPLKRNRGGADASFLK